MFGRKRRRRLLKVWDEKGEALFCDEICALEVPEAVVLALSEAFFNDPHPCEIHRSAVLSRVFAEFEEALPLNERTDVSSLTDTQRRCLPPGAQTLGVFMEDRT